MNAFVDAVVAGNVAGVVLAFLAYYISRDYVLSLISYAIVRGIIISLITPFRGEATLNSLTLIGVPLALGLAWSRFADFALGRLRRWWRVPLAMAVVSFLLTGYVIGSVVLMWESLVSYLIMTLASVAIATNPSNAIILCVLSLGFSSDVREYTVLFWVNASMHVPWYFLANAHAVGWMIALIMAINRGVRVSPSVAKVGRLTIFRMATVVLGSAGVTLGNVIPIARVFCDPPLLSVGHLALSCVLLSFIADLGPFESLITIFIRLAPFLLVLFIITTCMGGERK